MQGLRFDISANEVTGIWASTGVYDPNVDKCEHHKLRSFITGTATLSQQSVRAIQCSNGSVVIVMGCPGGRVRVHTPGDMRTDGNGSTHDLALNDTWESDDLGFGGSGLAVREEPGGELTIWFGTMAHPAPRPQFYGATQALATNEVVAGAVHRLTWTQGGGVAHVSSTPLYSNLSGLARAGYGVVGLHVADIMGGPEDEVIIGTLGGEVIVMTDDLQTVLWRATVPGSVGFYNSILVEDLDGIPGNELYVSGSLGLWRFK